MARAKGSTLESSWFTRIRNKAVAHPDPAAVWGDAYTDLVSIAARLIKGHTEFTPEQHQAMYDYVGMAKFGDAPLKLSKSQIISAKKTLKNARDAASRADNPIPVPQFDQDVEALLGTLRGGTGTGFAKLDRLKELLDTRRQSDRELYAVVEELIGELQAAKDDDDSGNGEGGGEASEPAPKAPAPKAAPKPKAKAKAKPAAKPIAKPARRTGGTAAHR